MCKPPGLRAHVATDVPPHQLCPAPDHSQHLEHLASVVYSCSSGESGRVCGVQSGSLTRQQQHHLDALLQRLQQVEAQLASATATNQRLKALSSCAAAADEAMALLASAAAPSCCSHAPSLKLPGSAAAAGAAMAGGAAGAVNGSNRQADSFCTDDYDFDDDNSYDEDGYASDSDGHADVTSSGTQGHSRSTSGACGGSGGGDGVDRHRCNQEVIPCATGRKGSGADKAGGSAGLQSMRHTAGEDASAPTAFQPSFLCPGELQLQQQQQLDAQQLLVWQLHQQRNQQQQLLLVPHQQGYSMMPAAYNPLLQPAMPPYQHLAPPAAAQPQQLPCGWVPQPPQLLQQGPQLQQQLQLQQHQAPAAPLPHMLPGQAHHNTHQHWQQPFVPQMLGQGMQWGHPVQAVAVANPYPSWHVMQQPQQPPGALTLLQ